MNKAIEKIRKKIIISCQASTGDPIYEDNCILSIIKSVIFGGATCLRLAGVKDITETKNLYPEISVIGITKPDPLPENWKEVVYITPTFEDAKKISDAGADIVAIDGTSRIRPKENLAEQIEKIHKELNKPVMADCATVDEGLMCELMGADMISTTLSGYTQVTLDKNNDEPDFEVLECLIKTIKVPVILEGRVWTTEHAKKAFALGAYAVVIGSAVTRPQVITRRFIDSCNR